jgi:hypothetical protein
LNTFAFSNEQGKTGFSGVVPIEMENFSVAEQACYFFSSPVDPRGMDCLEGRYQTSTSTVFSVAQKKPGNHPT